MFRTAPVAESAHDLMIPAEPPVPISHLALDCLNRQLGGPLTSMPKVSRLWSMMLAAVRSPASLPGNCSMSTAPVRAGRLSSVLRRNSERLRLTSSSAHSWAVVCQPPRLRV
jgi:hypothetical protein